MTTMTLPRQVRRQAEKADRDIEALKNGEQPVREDAPTTTEEATPPAPAIEAPPEAPPAETPAPVQGETEELRQQIATWEQRFRTLQGKYNAETQRNQEELIALRKKLDELTRQPPAPPKSIRDRVPENLRVVGDEILGASEHVAREAARDATAPLNDRIAAQEAELKSIRDQAFFGTLGTMCPKWRETNTDQKFLTWLDQPDGTSGQSRNDSLIAAHARRDAAHVAAIFNAYLSSTTPPPPPSSRLEGKVKPLPATQEPTRAPTRGPTISKQDVTKFYSDVAKGHYRNRPDEQKRREMEIDKAVKEGRVQ